MQGKQNLFVYCLMANKAVTKEDGDPMKISTNSKTVIFITPSAILPVKEVASSFSKGGQEKQGK